MEARGGSSTCNCVVERKYVRSKRVFCLVCYVAGKITWIERGKGGERKPKTGKNNSKGRGGSAGNMNTHRHTQK